MNTQVHSLETLQYIDGNWTASAGGEAAWQDILSPATSERLGRVSLGSATDASVAVRAARNAFDTTDWRYQHRMRSELMLRMADRLDARKDELADLLVTTNGKIRREAMGETLAAISEMRYYAGIARNLFGRTLEVNPGCFSSLDREAVGVAAIIVPWNAPVTLLIRSLAPALAAGCTTVIKGAEQTAAVTALMIEAMTDAIALPAGVLNLLFGPDTSPALCAQSGVDVISFTGSTQTGKRIAEAASQRLTRLSLELGGKAPAIVLGDCDVEGDPERVVAGALIQSGQQCTALARVLVHDSIYERFSAGLVDVLRNWRVGFGADPQTQMGPMINLAARDRIAGWVERAADHERLVLRGEIPGGELKNGAFIRPSLVAVEDLNSPFVQEEIFGPLLVIERFTTEDEAIERANATRFGLASSVWTSDLAKAKRVARRMHFGNVWHNSHNKLFAEIETGGFRESGIGKLHGLEAMNDFMHTKHFYHELNG